MLSEDLDRIANDLIAGFARSEGLAPAVVYRKMPSNPPSAGDRLSFPPPDPSETRTVYPIREDPAFSFQRGASGDARQTGEAYDLVRFVDALQLSGISPATGDEWEEGGKVYRVDKIQFGDPNETLFYFGLVFTRKAV